MKLSWSGFSLDFSEKTHVMGILNVTPDSFSDGGKYFTGDDAVSRTMEMVEEGADIIDIGGLSTRPGSEPVPIDEEIRRTIPVIEALKSKIGIPISIDTYRATVARKALEAGASMVNDISGLRFDSGMAKVVAEACVPLVIMHIKGTPGDMQVNPRYDALVPEIIDYLRDGIHIAEDAGIDNIIVDPGIGFGKTFDHNLELIHNLKDFTLLGKPVLVGPSRKAFLGKILGDVPPLERLEGTAAAVAACILNGANIVRVHDVGEMVKVAKVVDAIKRQRVQ